jgi:hypothetical protein
LLLAVKQRQGSDNTTYYSGNGSKVLEHGRHYSPVQARIKGEQAGRTNPGSCERRTLRSVLGAEIRVQETSRARVLKEIWLP